ncbi:glycerophosphodiester phosphodiesterase family protein [Dyadobacter sp. 3J3]|uniref:glycerophosphodiester phosphodiesterase n=1 Tax=Dyadobacter sp. 3J3 TaxID=2606600 RepID=UPI00135BA1EA|nr:glycerophosphodiester phosphodiesterase family protein [Dyadobacter sp. 3J3]
MKNKALFLALVSVFTFSMTVNADNFPADSLHRGVTAHRGNSIKYTENTLQAFQSGIDLGVDWVELDIYKTKDNEIVVLHDPTTKRVGDIDLAIANSTYEQLKKVDIATDFRTRNGKTLAECPAEHMPLLEDAVKLIMKQKQTHLSIQPKADCVAEAIEIVRKLKAENMVGFNDGSLKYMSDVKRIAPKIPVFWDRLPTTNVEEDIKIAKEKGFETLVIHYKGITEETVQKVKSAGLHIGTWTVNDRETLEKLLKVGVERIYTDDPALLISIKNSLTK